MALVTYTGRASRVRVAFDIVLERQVPTEIPVSIARGLSPAEFDVVLPTPRRPKSTTRRSAAAKRASAPKKES